MTTAVGDTYVVGLSTETARDLLGAAERLGLPAEVVRTTDQGFTVPNAVADEAMAAAQADVDTQDGALP